MQLSLEVLLSLRNKIDEKYIRYFQTTKDSKTIDLVEKNKHLQNYTLLREGLSTYINFLDSKMIQSTRKLTEEEYQAIIESNWLNEFSSLMQQEVSLNGINDYIQKARSEIKKVCYLKRNAIPNEKELLTESPFPSFVEMNQYVWNKKQEGEILDYQWYSCEYDNLFTKIKKQAIQEKAKEKNTLKEIINQFFIGSADLSLYSKKDLLDARVILLHMYIEKFDKLALEFALKIDMYLEEQMKLQRKINA